MKNIDTLCVQAGYKPKVGESRITPIYQSTTYYYETVDQMADLFDLKRDGYFYSRLANPTCNVIEEKITELEGGSMSIATSSGMSATLYAILNVCSAGDNFISSNAIYGGSYNLFSVTLKRYGIEARFVDPEISIEELDKIIDDKTRLFFGETIANPNIKVLDFSKFKNFCEKHKLLFIVDNTLATPYLCQPLSLGANVIIHSTSKYIDGHACALGGMVVDGGNFNFKDNPRYPLFNEEDDSYHGMIYADQGNKAYGVKIKVQLMRDMGAMMSPQNAFLTNLGSETLHVRMERHSYNTRLIAEFLNNHPLVDWVLYPTLKDNPYYERALKYLPKGCSGMMSFAIKGDTVKFIGKLKLIANVTHLGDLRSCILNPATTTHRQLPADVLEESGIPVKLIRLSVGIENVEDIINDLKQALEG